MLQEYCEHDYVNLCESVLLLLINVGLLDLGDSNLFSDKLTDCSLFSCKLAVSLSVCRFTQGNIPDKKVSTASHLECFDLIFSTGLSTQQDKIDFE